MLNDMNKFSSTEIHILENGFRWIKETKDRFGDKFYHLLREHPEVNPFLQSIEPWSFNKDFVQALDAVIGEIRSYGEVISPLKDFWPELSSTAMTPFEPSELINVAEIFLDLVSELAEDAWSPALEYAWRKAIKTVMADSWKPYQDPSISSFRSKSKPLLFNKGEGRTMTQPMMLSFAPMMFIVGGIAALGLWMRCHLVETRSKGRKALHFSVCS